MSTNKDTDQALHHARSLQSKMTKRLEDRGVTARSSKTGKFVTVSFARRNPTTTVKRTEK
ncbi:hypothetical protein [Clavibacter nebraskensis]|uniref:hypothetical protein n=1 Tax=Clavibacter nebraskensis TaxID=31963 RepID=UPI003F4B4C78